MKQKIINYLSNNIDSNYDKEVVIYGFEILYLNITKLLFILILAGVMGIIKETGLFLFFYGMLKLSSYGVHAAKTKICLTLSFIFTCLPMLIINNIIINKYILIILWSLVFMFFWKYAPADTSKKPIIDIKLKRKLKILSLITLITYLTLSILSNQMTSNIIIYTVILQSFLISPLSYKLLKEPYNNGKEK